MLLLWVPEAEAAWGLIFVVEEVVAFQPPFFLHHCDLVGPHGWWLGGSLVQDVGGRPAPRGVTGAPCQVWREGLQEVVRLLGSYHAWLQKREGERKVHHCFIICSQTCCSLQGETWNGKWQPTPVFLGKIPWTEEPGGLQSLWSQSQRNTHTPHTHTVPSRENPHAKGSRRGLRIRGRGVHSWALSTPSFQGQWCGGQRTWPLEQRENTQQTKVRSFTGKNGEEHTALDSNTIWAGVGGGAPK